MWSSSVQTGEQLSIAGITAQDLAKEFGTPTFFIDEADFRARALAWNEALKAAFGDKAGTVYYASKAFTCTEIGRWIKDLGIGIDVSTGGEMAVALAAGIDSKKIEVHGNNKSIAEIEKAISVGVETIVIDSMYEIERVAAAAAAKAGKVQNVLLRLTPGIQAHTHESISTAHEDVKFGFSISSGAAWAAITAVHTHPSLELRGFHAHIGSQIFGFESFEILAERFVTFLAKYRDEFKKELPELDLGGGYGIAYLEGDVTVDPFEAMQVLAAAVKKHCAAFNLQIPKVSIEPGRAIVGPTMFTLYEVGTVKDVVIEDDFVIKSATEVAWGMTTDQSIEILPSGKAILRNATITTKTLEVEIISPAGAKFTIESASKSATEKLNTGTQRLMVRIANQIGNVKLQIKLSPKG